MGPREGTHPDDSSEQRDERRVLHVSLTGPERPSVCEREVPRVVVATSGDDPLRTEHQSQTDPQRDAVDERETRAGVESVDVEVPVLVQRPDGRQHGMHDGLFPSVVDGFPEEGVPGRTVAEGDDRGVLDGGTRGDGITPRGRRTPG